jgi:hypothetical protein
LLIVSKSPAKPSDDGGVFGTGERHNISDQLGT